MKERVNLLAVCFAQMEEEFGVHHENQDVAVDVLQVACFVVFPLQFICDLVVWDDFIDAILCTNDAKILMHICLFD